MSVIAPPKHTCDRCGRLAPRVARTIEGGICRSCYGRDTRRFEECAQCGRRKVPSARTLDGKALCGNCARPKHVCSECGRLDHAKSVTNAGPLCQRCYVAPTRACGNCGNIRPVARRGDSGGVDLCKVCFQSPESRCGFCDRIQPVHTTWPLGPVCLSCYKRALRTPAECRECGEFKVLIGRDGTAKLICGPCAGVEHDYTCKQCGHAGPQHFSGTCLGCSIERLVSELLTTEHGAIGNGLDALPGILARRGDQASTMRWLIKPNTQSMLTTVGRETADATLTHETLDSCERVTARHYLRAMLVEVGVLPPRDEPIERFETWINELAAGLSPSHSALIGPYARWAVLRAARRRARRRGYTQAAADRGRERIRTAVRLIEHVEAQEHQIGDLTQSMLDKWTGGNRGRTSHVAGFIAWLTQRHIVENVTVEGISTAPPSEVGSEDDHVGRIAELLDNNRGIDLPTRVAGLLVLLYGARLPQIRQLTTADVTVVAGVTRLKLAKHPLELPGRVAVLVDDLAATTLANPRARTLDGTASYLFPGGRPCEPIHTTTLGRKLHDAGISARISRNHAMLALTTDLPAAVVATQFGLSISAATNWARFAQRDRTEYLLARNEARTDRTDKGTAADRRAIAPALPRRSGTDG